MAKMYKGFNKDLTCTPADGVKFQYEEGKIYETETAKLCNTGFHACEMPLDCFSYYPPATSVYHEVDLDDVLEKRDTDSKRVGKKITIGARLDIAGLIKAQIRIVKKIAHSVTSGDRANSATSGDRAHSATSGDRANSATSGDYANSVTSGYRAHSSASGSHSIAAALGRGSFAKAALGNWIVAAEYDREGPVCVKAALVDGEKIKPDVWYRVENGEFVEVDE